MYTYGIKKEEGKRYTYAVEEIVLVTIFQGWAELMFLSFYVCVCVYCNDFNAAILRNTRAVLSFNGKING